jgi:hypothetical protein
MLKVDPTEIKTRLDQLAIERYQWEALWQDVVDYMLPNRSPVIGTITPGEDRSVEMYDSTAYMSLLRLAANLNDMLTNQSSQWFQLGIDNEELAEDVLIMEWLDDTTKAVRKYLDNSNFYDQVHELYMDIGSFGTGILYIEDSDDEGKYLNFKACHIREIFIDEDKYGKVDTVFRVFTYTVRQCFQRWGDKISDELKQKYEDDPTYKVEIIHACFPRKERSPKKKDNKNMKYASVWMEKDQNHILNEGGYETFPYLTPRWMKSSGEMFGRSPAVAVLADIKTLNQMMETVIIAGQMIAEPPLQIPDDGFINLNVGPRGISYYRSGSNDFIRPLEIGSRLPITLQMMQQNRDSIANAFFTTQLQVIDKTEMTAEEVRARMQENMRIIGPTVGRLQNELLSDLIFRVLNILNYAKDYKGDPILPAPPPEVQGEEYSLKYVSPLAKAKRQNELQAINGAVGVATNWAQVKPEVLDNLDIDSAYRTVVDIMGAPNDTLFPAEIVAANREARAKAMEEERQLATAQGMSEVAERGSKAQLNQAEAGAQGE